MTENDAGQEPTEQRESVILPDLTVRQQQNAGPVQWPTPEQLAADEAGGNALPATSVAGNAATAEWPYAVSNYSLEVLNGLPIGSIVTTAIVFARLPKGLIEARFGQGETRSSMLSKVSAFLFNANAKTRNQRLVELVSRSSDGAYNYRLISHQPVVWKNAPFYKNLGHGNRGKRLAKSFLRPPVDENAPGKQYVGPKGSSSGVAPPSGLRKDGKPYIRGPYKSTRNASWERPTNKTVTALPSMSVNVLRAEATRIAGDVVELAAKLEKLSPNQLLGSITTQELLTELSRRYGKDGQ